MANTTFKGAVRSENGFKTVTKSSTLGTYTEYSNMNSSGNLYLKGGSHLQYAATTGYGPSDLIVGKGGSQYGTANPWAESSTQLFPLGSMLHYGNNVYRYGQMGSGAVTAGKLVQHAAAVAHHNNMQTTGAVSAGETAISVETGGTDLTLNQYTDGYLWVRDGTGEGQTLRVKSNPVHDHSDDPSVIITCYDALKTALGSGSATEVSLVANPYSGLIVAPTTHTGACMGATVVDMTADYYGWLCVSGPHAVLADGTLTLVSPAVRSDGTAGAVEVLDSDADAESQHIGQVMEVAASGEYALIWMNIH